MDRPLYEAICKYQECGSSRRCPFSASKRPSYAISCCYYKSDSKATDSEFAGMVIKTSNEFIYCLKEEDRDFITSEIQKLVPRTKLM